MFLDGTAQYVSDYDDYSPMPYHFDDLFVKPYDEMAEVCRFRKFVHKSSKAASRKRLAVIVYDNAALLGGSKKTSKDLLLMRFFEQWILAMDYLKTNHGEEKEGLEILGQKYQITLNCWQFLRPNISNIIHLAGLQLGDPDALKTLDQDVRRRQAKAELCRDFEAASREFVRKLTYVTGSDNQRLEDCFNRAISALAEIEDEASWTDS